MVGFDCRRSPKDRHGEQNGVAVPATTLPLLMNPRSVGLWRSYHAGRRKKAAARAPCPPPLYDGTPLFPLWGERGRELADVPASRPGCSGFTRVRPHGHSPCGSEPPKDSVRFPEYVPALSAQGSAAELSGQPVSGAKPIPHTCPARGGPERSSALRQKFRTRSAVKCDIDPGRLVLASMSQAI